MGPSLVPSKGGSRYYVSFTDDHTRYYSIYLMKHRSKFFEIYKAFRACVQTQHFAIIKCFWCDLDRECTLNKFLELLALDGTMQQISCIDTSENIGIVE